MLDAISAHTFAALVPEVVIDPVRHELIKQLVTPPEPVAVTELVVPPMIELRIRFPPLLVIVPVELPIMELDVREPVGLVIEDPAELIMEFCAAALVAVTKLLFELITPF